MIEKAKNHLRRDDKLKNIIDSVEINVQSNGLGCFQSLVKSIISQQLSNKAAATIYGRFLDLVGDRDLQSFLIETEIAPLRDVGLSFQKSQYVKNTATFFHDHQLTDDLIEKMDDASIISLLTQIKGVGQWTVEMILIFTLNRLDVLPIDDLIVRNGIKKILEIENLPKKHEDALIISKTEHWRPYRSIASLYIWANKDNMKS